MAIRKSRNDGELKPEALLNALRAFMAGDCSVRLPSDLSQRVPIVTNGKKKEGKLADQVAVLGVSGIWMDFTEGINKP